MYTNSFLQVVLCAYMMGEAARVAYVYYEKPVCNAHNPIDSKLAPVLWLFYVSKVRERSILQRRVQHAKFTHRRNLAPNRSRILLFSMPLLSLQVLDFFDTFFIIFRSKWTQFSFLHIYHHFSIFLTYWLVANAGERRSNRLRQPPARPLACLARCGSMLDW